MTFFNCSTDLRRSDFLSSWCFEFSSENATSMDRSFLIIFLLDLELNFISKLLVFRWELIVLLLLQICFFFVMREIS